MRGGPERPPRTPRVLVEESYVDFRGHRTWYQVAGDRSSGSVPLLALHGGPGSTHNYFAPLERLADRRPVVLYDQIGCGKSDRPTEIEWAVDVFREEVDTVREHLELERIHLLGTSWGGILALEHVLGGATGICSLILSSTLASIDEWVQEQRRLLREMGLEPVSADDPDHERVEQLYFDRHFYRGPKPRIELERMFAERNVDVYHAMQGPDEWTVTGALRGWDVRDRLGEIDIPTLVIRGRHDMSTEKIAATLVNGIRNAREVVLRDSSHTPVLEETDTYLATIEEFMRENERKSD
jgi:proline-specific peptidase